MVEILVFELAGQRCGVPAGDVREIVRAVTLLPLPGSPPVIDGVFDLRGTLVPVLDPRRPLGLPGRPMAHTDHLVVARAGARLVALRVDHATDLVRLPPEAVTAATTLTRVARALAGVVRLPDGLLLLHDLAGFLTEAEAEALDEALGGRA